MCCGWESLCAGLCGRHPTSVQEHKQIQCPGANSYGQLGLGHKEDVLLPQQLNDFCEPGCVRRITGGGGHSTVVTDEGGLFVCGLNKDGQLGLGHTEDVLYFTPCTSLLGCPIQQVACGWDFTIILTESGQVLSCGSNLFGQLGVPHGPQRCVVPQVIELLREEVVCVAAGLRHALAATASGIVFQWGTGLASSGRRLCPGQTLPLFLTAKEPSRVTGLETSKVRCVLAGSDHSASLTDAGELYVWGSNKHGQLSAQAAFLPVPQKIEVHCFQNEKVTAVWSGWTHLVAQTGRRCQHSLKCPRDPRRSLLTSIPLQPIVQSNPCLKSWVWEWFLSWVSCGSEHNLAVMGGVCYSWGWNEHGMCGDGTEANVWAPVPVQALRSSVGLHVGCGAGHSLALCQLPALPALDQGPKVMDPSPDATEDAGSQETVDRERN
ncbi:secretion-regulating guanine nucleotide exchange factor isoform X2 [Loxodonta africana]|uniref:secretion-regulating guanine nucleotide exchange factor isoform X2 n=1 Tax=Loxodonta africana TaxID=9785 RepID=UPI0030D21D75